MSRYEAWFLYNDRGRAAVEHVVHVKLPEGMGIQDIAKGFWIDDTGLDWKEIWAHGVRYATTGGTMWVPPGRITSVLRSETAKV